MSLMIVGWRWISKISSGIREPVMIAVNRSAEGLASHSPNPSVRNRAP